MPPTRSGSATACGPGSATAFPGCPGRSPPDLEEKAPFWRQWQRMLFDAGYAGLTWPREYGGQGLDERMRAIFTEECDRAGAPERLNIIGEDFAGPTIAHFGTEAQKRALPAAHPHRRGDLVPAVLRA